MSSLALCAIAGTTVLHGHPRRTLSSGALLKLEAIAQENAVMLSLGHVYSGGNGFVGNATVGQVHDGNSWFNAWG